MKTMSQRQERVAEQVRNEIATTLLRGDFAHPMLNGGMISIAHTWVSPDLRQCRVYFTPLAKDVSVDEIKEMIRALNDEAFRVQQVVAKLPMKYTPRIRFYYDRDMERTDRIEEAFNRIGAGHSDPSKL